MGRINFDKPRRPRRNQDKKRLIGGVSRRTNTTISTITLSGDGNCYVYGEEIDGDFVELSLDIPRRSENGVRRVPFTRREVRVRAGASDDIAAGAHLYLAELPKGQRRVHTALIQKYVKTRPKVVFEDMEGWPPPFNQAARRQQATDEEMISLFNSLPVNHFETGKVLVAPFISIGAGEFQTYDDASGYNDDVVWREGNLRVKDAAYAVGAVRKPETVRNAVLCDDKLQEAFRKSGDGTYRVKPSQDAEWQEIPLEVGTRASEHLEIAVDQALAGAGDDAKRRVGQPVATYALDLFNHHLLNAKGRLSGRTGCTESLDDERFAHLAFTPPDDDSDDGERLH